MILLSEPSFMYENNNEVMFMHSIIDNLILTVLTTGESSKPILMALDVFEKEYVDIPDEIFDNIKSLTAEAKNNGDVIRTEIGGYIWDKVLAYIQHGYGYTPDLVKKFEQAAPLETTIIKDFFQPFNVKNKITSLEAAIAPLTHIK